MADKHNLVVLTFEGQDTAAAVYEQLEHMEAEKLLEIRDAIIIERESAGIPGTFAIAPPGSGHGGTMAVGGPVDDPVRVVQKRAAKGKYAAKGAGIGLLAGWLLGGPIGGLAVGAGIGGITAGMKDFGIDDKNIDAIKARLQPNTSALLVLGTANDQDALVAKLRTFDPQVVLTSLTPEVEKQLRGRLEG